MAGGARSCRPGLGGGRVGSSADVAAAIHEAAARGERDQPVARQRPAVRGGGARRRCGPRVRDGRGCGGRQPGAGGLATRLPTRGLRRRRGWPEGRRAPYSQHGRHLIIAAPGGDAHLPGRRPRGVPRTPACGRPRPVGLPVVAGDQHGDAPSGVRALFRGGRVTRPAEVEAIPANRAPPDYAERARHTVRPVRRRRRAQGRPRALTRHWRASPRPRPWYPVVGGRRLGGACAAWRACHHRGRAGCAAGCRAPGRSPIDLGRRALGRRGGQPDRGRRCLRSWLPCWRRGRSG